MERLLPGFELLEPEDIYRDLSFPPGSDDRPYVAINMVTTVDGKATNLAGTVRSLSSKADRFSMRRIRSAVDGVMNGAETLRRENVNPSVPDELIPSRLERGLAPQPVALTITASCDIPPERTFFHATGVQPVVITTKHAPPERVEELAAHSKIIIAGEHSVDLTLMMHLLVAQLGIRTMVVEGGPTLNARLISARMVDELFWSVSPQILGGPAERTMVEETPIPVETRPGLELLSVYRHESELFLRYRFAHGDGEG